MPLELARTMLTTPSAHTPLGRVRSEGSCSFSVFMMLTHFLFAESREATGFSSENAGVLA